MFATKLKSPADITPVLATKTARPVIPPNVKLLEKLEEIDSNCHDQDASG